jgi:O-antigen ligase
MAHALDTSNATTERFQFKDAHFQEKFSSTIGCLIDISLVAVIVLTPLLLGGRSAWAHLLLATAATLATLCWGCQQWLAPTKELQPPRFLRCGITYVMFAAAGLLCVQLIPLSASTIRLISPQIPALLPTWFDGSNGVGAWQTISLTPTETRSSLALLVSFTLLFLVVLERIRTLEDIKFFLRWIAIMTIGLATFGLLQYYFGNGKYFWFFEYPGSHETTGINSTLVGSFTNRNHFAHMMALGIGPLIWWTYDAWWNRKGPEKVNRSSVWGGSSKSRNNWIVSPTFLRRIGALSLCIVAGVMTLSRGGSLAIMLSLLIVLAIGCVFQILNRKTALGIAVGISCLILLFCLVGTERIANRFADFASAERLDPWQTRQKIWHANFVAFKQFPFAGTGAGSHHQVIPIYFESYGEGSGETEFTHAENGYVQVATENGTLGICLLVVGIGFVAWWSSCTLWRLRKRTPSPRTQEHAVIFAAVVATILASAAHSLVDFVWYVPACVVPVLFCVTILFRLFELSKAANSSSTAKNLAQAQDRRWDCAKLVTVAAAIAMVAIGPMQIRPAIQGARAEASWYAYLRESFAEPSTEETEQLHRTNRMIIALENVLKQQPNHSKAPSRLSALYLRRFELPDGTGKPIMALPMVRDAARASEFASHDEKFKWLTTAFGRRTRYLTAAVKRGEQALQRCPLQGEVYLHLNQVDFMQNLTTTDRTSNEFVSQAVRVRPHDGRVLIAAGQEAILTGDIQSGLQFWEKAFHLGTSHRDRILQIVVGKLPIELIVKELTPTVSDLEVMAKNYQLLGDDDGWALVLKQLANQCEREAAATTGDVSAEHWATAARSHSLLGNSSRCGWCLRQGLELRPYSYPLRRSYGLFLAAAGEKTLAEKHLQWCLAKQPRDPEIRVILGLANAANYSRR